MSITINKVDSISETEFNTFWDYSRGYILSQEKPSMITKNSTEEQIKQTIKNTFFNSNSLFFNIFKNDLLIGIANCNQTNDSFLESDGALFGPDENNSRSWIYSSDYWSAWKVAVDNLNLNGLKSKVMGSVYEAILEGGINNYYPNSTFTKELQSTSDNIYLIKFTHLN